MVTTVQAQFDNQQDYQAQSQHEHGGKQVYGMNYYKIYAPVVTWVAIRLMIVFGILFKWSLQQFNFIMAYPQAPIEMDICMELPQGIKTDEENSKEYVLQLLRNTYGQ
jgi:hypothetical protein